MRKMSEIVFTVLFVFFGNIMSIYGLQDTFNPDNPPKNLTNNLPINFDVPNGTKDTISAAFDIPDVLIKNDYNMFYAPSTLLNYGTAYGEIWNAGTPWGGASVKLPAGFKTLFFLGRPYNSVVFVDYATAIDGGNGNRGNFSPTSSSTVGITTLGGTAISLTPDFTTTPFHPQHSVDLLLGKKIGSVGLGFKYSLFYNSDENKKSVI